MSVAQEIYPETCKDEFFYGPDDYTPIVRHLIPDLALHVDERDYQGSSWVLGRDPGGAWLYLEFGWGSCSGCDALQGCNSVAELDALIEQMRTSLKRWESPAEAMDWFHNHDWGGDWSCAEKTDFVARAKALLEKEVSR